MGLPSVYTSVEKFGVRNFKKIEINFFSASLLIKNWSKVTVKTIIFQISAVQRKKLICHYRNKLYIYK